MQEVPTMQTTTAMTTIPLVSMGTNSEESSSPPFPLLFLPPFDEPLPLITSKRASSSAFPRELKARQVYQPESDKRVSVMSKI